MMSRMSNNMPSPAETLGRVAQSVRLERAIKRRGVVTRVADAIAIVAGLDDVGYEEIVTFDTGDVGLAFDLRDDSTGVLILSDPDGICEGAGVVSAGAMPDIPVGQALLGRVIDPLGNPLDQGLRPVVDERIALFREAPTIVDRTRVQMPLHTGITAIDGAIPIGRGQRQLIIGDRNVGKTALALDIVDAQTAGDVTCVYVVIGQPMSRVLTLRNVLSAAGRLNNVVIVAADASMTPGMRYLAPYAGTSVAEWFRDRGGHAVVIYDDLTKHADSYRELALLLDRSPGREAYPGDIFYLHAEILERAAALRPERGGGTVTALPIVETTDGDIAAYIPTNLISITDGQIYLDSARFDRNQRPAIDVARSVSRIGSVAQPPTIRVAAKNLRITLARFESLETLTRAGLDMDPAMQSAIQRGRVLRALLRQAQLSPRSVAQQAIALTVVNEGLLDDVDPADVGRVVNAGLSTVETEYPDLIESAGTTGVDSDKWRDVLKAMVDRARSSST